jgi:hypothetical protein
VKSETSPLRLVDIPWKIVIVNFCTEEEVFHVFAGLVVLVVEQQPVTRDFL